MKKVIFLIILILFLIYSFFNLGNFLDVTEKPVKTDLLVCLGGGKTRINKTLELYEKKFLKSNIIILTGYEGSRDNKLSNIPDKRLIKIRDAKYKSINFIINYDLKNTAEEIIFVKKYMKKNKLKSAIFITEEAHSRRVMLLIKFLKNSNDENLSFRVVKNDVYFWNKDNYYKNKFAREYAYKELIKIVYNTLAYGILYKFGYLENFEKYFENTKPIIIKKINELKEISF